MDRRVIIWDNSIPNPTYTRICNDKVYVIDFDHKGDHIYTEDGKRLYNLDGFLNIDEYLFKNYGYTTSDILVNKDRLNDIKFNYVSINYTKTMSIYIQSLDGNHIGMIDPKNLISIKQERLRIIDDILK